MKLTPEQIAIIVRRSGDGIANQTADALSDIGRELTDEEYSVIYTHAEDAVRKFLAGIDLSDV